MTTRKALTPTHFLKGHLSYTKATDGTVVIEGYANKAIVDRGNDLIPPEAWAKGLEDYKKNPIILFNHHPDQMVGSAMNIEPTKDGLYLRAKISNSNDDVTSRVRNLVKDGVLRAFSVGFDSSMSEKDSKGVNVIKEAKLYEVSIVGIPMNQESLFTVIQKGSGKKTTKKQVMEELDQLEKSANEKGQDPVSEGKTETSEAPKAAGEGQPPAAKPEPEAGQVIKGSTGVTEGHSHGAEWNSASGTGETSGTVGDYPAHAHVIKDMKVEPGGEDNHTHSLEKPQASADSQAPAKGEDAPEQKQAGDNQGQPTVPMESQPPPNDFGSPFLDAANQTNILLGALIKEVQLLRAAVEGKAVDNPSQDQPATQAPQPPQAPPQPVNNSVGETETKELQERSKQYGVEAFPFKDDSVPYGVPIEFHQFGDPVNLQFPIDTLERASNARIKFRELANKSYTRDKSKSVVHNRIVRAELALGGKPTFDSKDPLDMLLDADLRSKLEKGLEEESQKTLIQSIARYQKTLSARLERLGV